MAEALSNKKSFLCRIGLHRWRNIGCTLFADALDECRRCGIGRMFMLPGAEVRYTKEQMQAIREENAERNGLRA